ncbi:VOC family protein [Chloroflexi bacterium TSY]|nr:VOC family protein [Chloroflexi bacterium TSY]
MIKNIATVGVYVEDQDKALEFWTEKFGFQVNRDQDMGNGSRWLEVCPQGAESCLVIYPKSLMKNWAELKPSIVFECENIEALCDELHEKGVMFKLYFLVKEKR